MTTANGLPSQQCKFESTHSQHRFYSYSTSNFGCLWFSSPHCPIYLPACVSAGRVYPPGRVDSLYFLGLLKLYGISVAPDADKALEYMRKAAELRQHEAMAALGVMLLHGRGEATWTCLRTTRASREASRVWPVGTTQLPKNQRIECRVFSLRSTNPGTCSCSSSHDFLEISGNRARGKRNH